MKQAMVAGKLVTGELYRLMSNNERADAGAPICRECGSEVHPYGVASPGVTPRFDHPDAPSGVDRLDDCSLARRSQRLRWFGMDAVDEHRGISVRNAFFEHDSVVGAYAFCLAPTGRGRLSLALFRSMLARADRMSVWSYVGIEPWCIPHVLLLLADFETAGGDGFHFSLMRASRLGGIWESPRPVELVKLFSDSHRPFENQRGGQNPRPILASDVAEVDTEWMGSGMIRTLRSFAGSDGGTSPDVRRR